jgi:hypothetical protein
MYLPANTMAEASGYLLWTSSYDGSKYYMDETSAVSKIDEMGNHRFAVILYSSNGWSEIVHFKVDNETPDHCFEYRPGPRSDGMDGWKVGYLNGDGLYARAFFHGWYITYGYHFS